MYQYVTAKFSECFCFKHRLYLWHLWPLYVCIFFSISLEEEEETTLFYD